MLQEKCSKDDIYYNQNMIVGYFSEGVLNIEMNKNKFVWLKNKEKRLKY